MTRIRFGDVLYIRGRIGWQRLSKSEYLENGDYYLITGVNITEDNRIDFSKCYCISKERYDLDDKIQVRKGDIIVTKDGTIGKIAMIEDMDKPATLNNHLFLIRNLRPDILDTRYLFYILRSRTFQHFAVSNSSGTNVPFFTQANISKFETDLPSAEVQGRIADVLSLIERKIRLNRSISASLESVAKQFYDYWFVQFDFPDGRGRPYKTSGGKMVWNEKLKREVPDGWNCVPLNQFADIVNGDTPETSVEGNYGGDIVWITPRDLSCQKSKFIYKCERRLSQRGFDSCSASILPVGTVLMSSRAPIGLLSIARHELCTNQGIKSFVPKDNDDSCYLYFFTKDLIPQMEHLASGTTFKEISREDVARVPILRIGNAEVKRRWLEIVTPIFDEQFLRYQEIVSLTEQRDRLLPLLMNGPLSVGE